MKRNWLWMAASVLGLVGATLSACGQQPENPIAPLTQMAQPDESATAAPIPQAVPAVTATLVPAEATAFEATAALTPEAQAGNVITGPASKETIEKAKTDLAQKLNIPLSQISVIAVIGQEFTTDGFYCRTNKDRISKDEPKASINGETILLVAGGIRYEYHTDGQAVIFCRPLT